MGARTEAPERLLKCCISRPIDFHHSRAALARLELAGVLVAPAFDDDFFIGVELDGVASLRVHVAEEAALPSGEGEISHGRSYPNIDADVACGSFVPEAARCRPAGSEKRSLVAVWAALQEGYRFVHVSGVDQTQYRAEYFRVGELAGCGHAVENGWFYEIS